MPSKPHKNRCDGKSLDGMNETTGSDGGFLVPPQHGLSAAQPPMTKALIAGKIPPAPPPAENTDDGGHKVPPLNAVNAPTDIVVEQSPGTPSMAPGPETSAVLNQQPQPPGILHPGGTQVIQPALAARLVANNLAAAQGLTAAHRARHAAVVKQLLGR